MKRINKFRVIWLVALLFFVAGVVLTFKTFRQLHDADRKLKEKLYDISMMQEYSRNMSVYIAAKEAYKRVPSARPVKFESVFDTSEVSAKDNIRSSELALEDDWFVLRREIVIDDGELGNAMMLIRKAEAQRPPWKLSSCNIKSSSIIPGHGRMVLTFEAMEKR